MGINNILNCVKTFRATRTTYSLYIFALIILLSPFCRADDNNLPRPNSPPRQGQGMFSVSCIGLVLRIYIFLRLISN